MKKFARTILTLFLFTTVIGVGATISPYFAQAQTTAPATPAASDPCSSVVSLDIHCGLIAEKGGQFLIDVIGTILAPILGVVLKLTALLAYMGGVVLDKVVDFTILHVKDNVTGLDGINAVWGTVRDVANMSFIFVLLYTAIMTMFGQGDYQKTIKNIVIAAILINFSLFFTKVIIDAGNVIGLTFYNALVPTGASFSGIFTQHLGLTTIWNGTVSSQNVITIGILGSVFLLIASFVFLAVALMFVVRYVILLIVLMLSPLGFVANAIPNLQGYGEKWWKALLNQTFFPAIYFFLTWIVVRIISSSNFIPGNIANALTGINGASSPDAANTILKFVVIIALLIMTLVLSKSVADKGAYGINSWVTKKAGGATLGVAGKFGRGTIGRASQALADNEKLKAMAPTSRLARLALATSNRTASSSFDLRGTPLGGTLGGGKAQKGGFAADMKAREKLEVDRAKSYKASDSEKKRVEDAEKAEKDAHEEARKKADEARNLRFESLPSVQDARAKVERARQEINIPLKLGDDPALRATREASLKAAQAELEKFTKPHEAGRALNVDLATSKEAANLQTATKAREAVTGRMESYAKTLEEQKTLGMKFSILGRIFPGFIERKVLGMEVGGVKKEYTRAAAAIRKEAKGKSTDEQIAELSRKKQKEADDAAAAATGGTAPTATPPAGGTPGTPPPKTP